MTMRQFYELVRQAFQYGPFLFALLFNLVITRWAHKVYTKACKRENPPASNREKNTSRLYFWVIAGFGMGLVVVSVIWWFQHQPFTHVFKGVIQNLNSYEKITSQELYFRRHPHERLSPELPEYYDAHFAATQDKPFAANQTFIFRYWKEGVDWENRAKRQTEPEDLSLNYCTEAKPKFKIKFHKESGTRICQKISATQKHSSLFVSPAHAQPQVEPSESKGLTKDSRPSLELPILHISISPMIIPTLQNERTDIPTKIATLDELNTLSDEELKEYIEASTSKEPMILTLSDLSRHTDDELAYKAWKIMERFDWHSIVVNRLLSSDTKTQREAETILFRTEKDIAEEVLHKASSEIETAQLNELQEEIRSAQRTRVLIPTGSWQGDRYYVKAEWDPTQGTVVTRLTELFNTELLTDRTLEEEVRLMEGRTERYVYWYSKEWALWIAEKIEQCGARASFIGFPTSTSE